MTTSHEFDDSDPNAFLWSYKGIRSPHPSEPKAPAPRPPEAKPHPPRSHEHRHYPRIDLKLPVLYKIMSEEPTVASTALQPYVASKSDNISVKGVCLILAEGLPAGTVLALSIHVPGEKQKISAIARVVWSQPTEISHHFLTGLEFIVVYRKTASTTEYIHPTTLEKLFIR